MEQNETPGGLSRRGLIAGASAAAAAAAWPAGPARAAIPIKIADASGGLSLTMAALMRQEKVFEAFGLEPDVMQIADGSRIMGAIVGGGVDCSLASGFAQVFPAIERGAPLKIIGGASLRPGLAMYTGKPDVNSLKDLEGKTIGTGSVGALVYELVVVLLRKYGVDVSKIRFVNIGSSPDVFRAVSAGTVDAGPSDVSLIPNAAHYHVRAIPHGNMAVELPQYTYQAAWTSDHKIATNRDALVRALAASAKLYRFVQTPQAKPAFIQARRTAFPSETDADHEAEWTYVQTFKPFAVNLALSPERLRYIQTINLSFKTQQTMLPFERVADMSLAADALKLLR